jgi:AraC-like DNA-binding protein
MSLDTQSGSLCDDPTPISWKPPRRMKVRHRYPESLVELVGHLRTRMPAREIAAALDIPLSSIYRWAPVSNATLVNDVTHWEFLVARCRADGFVVPQSIAGALPSPTKIPAVNELRRRTLPRGGLEAARSMIECNYFRSIDSNALAAAAGLSRFRFIHAFTAAYGISPHQHLLRTRIAAAKKLLTTSRETIDVIATATGFRSGGCLNRAFTRVEGHCISRFCRIVGDRP